MVDRPDTTPIGQHRKTLTFNAFLKKIRDWILKSKNGFFVSFLDRLGQSPFFLHLASSDRPRFCVFKKKITKKAVTYI